MSESAAGGWSQSSSPFTGLTAPPFAGRGRPPVTRSSAVLAGLTRIRRHRRRRRDGHDSQQHSQGTMMMKVYEDILAALRESVAEVVAANPADLDGELAKRFDGAEVALGEALATDLPLLAGEVDHITLLADRLEDISAVVLEIEGGACLKVAGVGASEEVLELAKRWIDLGQIVVRAMAVEHATHFADGDALGDGEQLFKLFDGADGQEILVKTALPDHVAEMLVPAGALVDELVAFGADLLAYAGIGPQELAKAFPPKDGEGDEEGDGEGDEEGDGEGEGEGDEEGEGEGEGALDGQDDNPVEAIAELGAMILVQVDAIKQQMGGDMAGAEGGEMSAIDAIGEHAALIVVQADAIARAMAGDEGGDDQSQGQEQAQAAPADQGAAVAKQAPAGELAKGASSEVLHQSEAARQDAEAARKAAEAARDAAEARVAAAEARLEALQKVADARPAEGKAVLRPQALAKSADMTANEGGETEETREQQAERLAKLSPDAAGRELMKMVHSSGGLPFDPRKA